MNRYTNEDYCRAYSEVLGILRYIPKKDLIKIPKDEIKFFIKNMDKNYNYNYNFNKQFEEQKLMILSKIIIANIYIKYLAKNKEELLENERKELRKINEANIEMLKTDYVLKNKSILVQNNDINSEDCSLMVIESKGIFRKIINKIRRLLKLT